MSQQSQQRRDDKNKQLLARKRTRENVEELRGVCATQCPPEYQTILLRITLRHTTIGVPTAPLINGAKPDFSAEKKARFEASDDPTTAAELKDLEDRQAKVFVERESRGALVCERGDTDTVAVSQRSPTLARPRWTAAS